jgi:hypothetical protein
MRSRRANIQLADLVSVLSATRIAVIVDQGG